MKYLAIMLILCVMLSGCTATAENTQPQKTPTQQGETTAPQTDPTVSPETPPPTGEDSSNPSPEIGPEGLPTPSL